jgi:hypothetical protein
LAWVSPPSEPPPPQAERKMDAAAPSATNPRVRFLKELPLLRT